MRKRIIAIICVFIISFSLILPVGAAEVNQVSSEQEYTSDESVLVDIIRTAMVNRQRDIVLYYESIGDGQLPQGVWENWLELAVGETGYSNEGDYLRWCYSHVQVHNHAFTYDAETEEQRIWKHDVTITLDYYATKEQETQVKQVVGEVLSSIGITDALSDYEKATKIYDYICANVTYDHEHLNDKTYGLKFSAYAALIQKTAVCQGYATLYYYMAREAGLDVRVISGTSEGEYHTWNIIKLDDKYYNLDSTWDAGADSNQYHYYLKGSEHFDGHIAADMYLTKAFMEAYPISKDDYVYHISNKHEWNDFYTIDVSATCTSAGSKSVHCSGCNTVKNGSRKVIPKLGHNYGTWRTITAATYLKTGTARRDCNRCTGFEKKSLSKVQMTSIKLRATTVKPFVDMTAKLTVECKPLQPKSSEIQWKSSNTKVATVDAQGNVRAIAKGTAIITATVGGVSIDCDITVIALEQRSVKAELYGNDDVKISWSKEEGANCYYVEYKNATASKYVYLATTSGSYLKVENLADGVKYAFRVTPLCKDRDKVIARGTAKATTITTVKTPKAVKTVTTKLYGYDDVQISWSKSSNANYYQVYYKKAGAKKYTYLGMTAKTSYKKADLADGVKYTFCVKPVYIRNKKIIAQGVGKTSSIYTLKKVSIPKVKKVSSSKVKVSWSNINGETGYQISKTTSKAKTSIVATYKTTSGKTKNISAKKGKTYYYRVRAYRSVNGKKIPGPWSNAVAYKVR